MGRFLTKRSGLRAGVLAASAALCAMLLPTASAAPPTAVAHSTAQSFDFVLAKATYNGKAYHVVWRSHAGPVVVVANHDPRSAAGGTEVGRGPAKGGLTVSTSTLPAGKRWYFHLRNPRRSVTIAPQGLGLAHDPNLRDIGGIRTADGHWIREGLLFRGGAMDKLTDAEVARLADLGITTAVDFRTHDEAVAAPDRLPSGVNAIADSVLVNDDPSVTWAIGDLDVPEVFKIMGYARGQYLFIYDELGGSPGGTHAYRTFFKTLLNAHGAPVLYHCTAGDDRTGWATYVLMRLLGVTRNEAMLNYLDSNKFNSAVLQGYTDYFEQLGFTHEQADFFLKSDYINAAERTALQVFGSWDRYVSQGLGLTSADIAALKKTYLAS